MNTNDVAGEASRLVSRLADEANSVAMAAGFVALGAAVVVGRSLLDTVREAWKRLPSLRGRDDRPRTPKAA